MTATILERTFRRFLLIVVECLCLGTIVELYLAKHDKDPIQFVPFVLCAIGFLSVLAVLVRPGRTTILMLRVVMGIVALGSLLGFYEHLASNVDFESQMHPGVSTLNVILPSFMGAAPLLAPGILAFASTLALAATYYHPLLGKRSDV